MNVAAGEGIETRIGGNERSAPRSGRIDEDVGANSVLAVIHRERDNETCALVFDLIYGCRAHHLQPVVLLVLRVILRHHLFGGQCAVCGFKTQAEFAHSGQIVDPVC